MDERLKGKFFAPHTITKDKLALVEPVDNLDPATKKYVDDISLEELYDVGDILFSMRRPDSTIWQEANGSVIPPYKDLYILGLTFNYDTPSDNVIDGENLEGIVFYGNIFVAVGQNGLVVTSPDAVTWTKRTVTTIPSEKFIGVVRGFDNFIAVSDDNKSYISSDGITWTKASIPHITGKKPLGLKYFSGYTIMYGDELAYSTDDGITWTNRGAVLGGTNLINDVFMENGTMYAIGETGLIAESSNYNTWVLQPEVLDGTNLAAMDFVDDKYVVIAKNGRTAYSLTPNNWEEGQNLSSSGQILNKIVAVSIGLIAYGFPGTLYITFDGTTWVSRPSGLGFPTTLLGATVDSDGRLVFSGEDGRIGIGVSNTPVIAGGTNYKAYIKVDR